MIEQKDLEALAKSPFGLLLLAYLKQESERLRNIDGVKTFEELLGRQEAVKILDKMFKFIENAQQPKETGQQSKNEYQ